MKIYIAADHAGFDLKKGLIEYLKSRGIEVIDMGANEVNGDDDYPDFIYPLAKKVGSEVGALGIVIGGSGQGEAIVANKARGVRAAVYYGGNLEIVRRSRDHNDSNILSLGARFMSVEEAKEAVSLWLSTKFPGTDRHQRRHDKIKKIEEQG